MWQHVKHVRGNRRKFLAIAGTGVAAGAGGLAIWIATSKQRGARWVRTIIEDSKREPARAAHKPDPATWSDNGIYVSWIGHATVLISFYGVRILTDPAFGDRVGLDLGFGTAGPKRYVAPALSLKELPPIDLLLLSHAHMDHMDTPTLGKLKPETVTLAKVTSDVLPRRLRPLARELAWNDKVEVRTSRGNLEIEAFEVKHWGKRWPNEEKDRGYNGYILRREGRSLVFGGDTAMVGTFHELKSKGPFEAAIMPIGAYRPWIWNHCSPEEAWRMANDAGAKYLVPVHHQTFVLSHEPLEEPLERLEEAARGERDRIGLREIGETLRLT